MALGDKTYPSRFSTDIADGCATLHVYTSYHMAYLSSQLTIAITLKSTGKAYEFTRMVEDLEAVISTPAMLEFYIEDAIYAIEKELVK